MRIKQLLLLTVLVTVSLALEGCGLLIDRRDAPWDPRAGSGRHMMDQIPNWDGEANRVCGGHLPPSERGHRSPRC